MATTTNYGWTTPDDTALVKDGAAAIRSLGSAIDTTTKNLNPGTTNGDIDYYATGTTKSRVAIGSSGQCLTVVAGVPSWAASPTSVLTTTGDLLYASAANTLARRAIGSTGDVLTVSGGLPTWAAPSTGSYTLLSTTTLASTSTVISSISGSYTDLMIIINNPFVNVGAVLRINPNGAASIGYSSGTQGATTVTETSIVGVNNLPTATNAQNSYALFIRQYSQTSYGKPFSFHGGTGNENSAVNRTGWIHTTSAISSITITTVAGTSSFSGGQVLIYGVK